MKQLKVNKEKCIACGLCTAFNEYIDVDEQGFAVEKNDGIVSEAMKDKIKQIIAVCPQQAITFGEYESNNKISTVGDLMLFMKERLEKYELPRIQNDDIEFPRVYNGNSSCIWIDLQDSNITKIFTSERKAEIAGMRDVTNNVNNVVRNIIRGFLSEYKTGILNKFRVEEDEKGNYYYDCISEAEGILKQCALECKNIFDVDIPSELLKIRSRAVWYAGYDRKRCALDYLEDRLIDIAMDNVESPSWYETWINVDGDEKIWTVSVSEANETIAKHAWDGFKEACEFRNIYPIIEQTIETFNENIKKEMLQKYHDIIDYLNKNVNLQEILKEEGDWERKARIKVLQRAEQQGDLKSLRRLISVPELAKENAKKEDSRTCYQLELDVKALDGKRVSAGEVIANLGKGIHWHCYAFNNGQSQPYGCGVPVDLKKTYPVIAETDGIVHIFTRKVSTDSYSIGVIAHPKDNNEKELCDWFYKNKL